MVKYDKELEEFRSIMEVPSSFEDGFSFSSLLGALFLAIVMVPGALYMELVAGMGVGPAAQWVTVILFIEIAKRANAKLSRAQLFVLFYIAGLIVGQRVNGTPLFRQYLVRSSAAVATGITTDVPFWAAPNPADELAYEHRTFFQLAWLPAIGLIAFNMFFGKINHAILGYGLFRIASDIEKLPFPLAPIGAQGILALAEDVEGTTQTEGKKFNRMRLFGIGGAIGMVFGFLYMGLPTLTGAILGTPLKVFPIPFVEWSNYTKEILPAVATGFSFQLGQVIFGMVMPFWAMVGSFFGLIVTFVLNPILYNMKILTLWEPNDKTIEILFKNNINFYFSFGIGLSLAVAVVGFVSLFRMVNKKEEDGESEEKKDSAEAKTEEPATGKSKYAVPEGRGDIPPWFIITAYLVSTLSYILLSGYLIDWHPGVLLVLVFLGFIYTPLISYVTARLEGLAGQVIEIPFIREICFILSGYQGVAIWFIPVPQGNFGTQTVFYKQAELLGVKFTAMWKSNFLLMPLIFFSLIGFSSFIWGLAEIPSVLYPYTQEIWDLRAKNACLLYSSTMKDTFSQFEQALSIGKIAIGFGSGMAMYAVLSFFNAPILLMYGCIRGLGQTMPHIVIPQFIGALLGKFYFRKKYGSNWRKYIPVVSAGFMVGSGLVTMFCIGIVFLIKSTSSLPY